MTSSLRKQQVLANHVSRRVSCNLPSSLEKVPISENRFPIFPTSPTHYSRAIQGNTQKKENEFVFYIVRKYLCSIVFLLKIDKQTKNCENPRKLISKLHLSATKV